MTEPTDLELIKAVAAHLGVFGRAAGRHAGISELTIRGVYKHPDKRHLTDNQRQRLKDLLETPPGEVSEPVKVPFKALGY